MSRVRCICVAKTCMRQLVAAGNHGLFFQVISMKSCENNDNILMPDTCLSRTPLPLSGVFFSLLLSPACTPAPSRQASMSVKDMLAEFKMEDKRNEQQSNNNRAVAAAAAAAAASASAPSTAGTPSSSVSSSSSFSSSSSSSSSPYSFPSSSSADSARGGDVAVGPDAGRLGAAVVEPGSSQKPRKGKKGKKERRR